MFFQNKMFVALDQSTSATKAMLFSTNGCLVDQKSISHHQIYPRPGWVEHDANEIYDNVIKVIKTLFLDHPDQISEILALSITNQRETFVVFDRETGLPLHNAIVWQCRRGNDICENLINEGFEKFVHESTGLKIDTYFPASKLKWLLNTCPKLDVRIKDGSALFGTIDTYLIYRLTGGKVYATDHSNASRTLLYDIGALDWSQDLLKVFGLEFGALPDIRESSDLFGDTNFEGFLDCNLPICGVMGDSQAALFAQRCFYPGSAKVTFGTGSSILLNIGQEKRFSENGNITALAWVMKGTPTYAFEGIINFTGATITWLRDQLQIIQSPSETEELARSVPGSDGVYFIPAFVGLSAPYWRSDVRAAILGMTPSTTRAHVVRSALESIAYIITDVLRSMCLDAGMQLNMIHVDGGAVQNKFLMQFVADMNQIVVRASDTLELSALGAVFNSFLGLGVCKSYDEIQKLPFGFVEFSSSMEFEHVNSLYAGWKSAVQQVLYQPKQG